MSRSIHKTYRDLTELEDSEFSDGDSRAERIAALKTELWTKRRIKRHVKSERRRKTDGPPPTVIDAIPINVTDVSAGRHLGTGAAGNAIGEKVGRQVAAGPRQAEQLVGVRSVFKAFSRYLSLVAIIVVLKSP